MILSLTVAACADSVAYVMVSCTLCWVFLPTHRLVGGLSKCWPVLLPPKGESLAEGPLCSFQAWWLTYFGKGKPDYSLEQNTKFAMLSVL